MTDQFIDLANELAKGQGIGAVRAGLRFAAGGCRDLGGARAGRLSGRLRDSSRRFSWPAAARATLAVYRELIETPGSP